MRIKKFFKNLKDFMGNGVTNFQFAFTLLNPMRRFILSPEEMVKRLELKKNSKVLELGPGPGYFSVEVAKNIPEGNLLLVDLQSEMLDKAKKRLIKSGLNNDNVSFQQGDAENLPLKNNSFDIACTFII